MVTRLPELSWKRQRFTHFFTKHGEPLKLQKVGSARRMTHLVQSPFCNGRVSLQAGPKFLCRHFTRFPFKKFLFQISEKPLAQWKVHSSCTDQTKATASLVIVLVSRIQISGPGEDNFVKWKGTFRSDRQIRIGKGLA